MLYSSLADWGHGVITDCTVHYCTYEHTAHMAEHCMRYLCNPLPTSNTALEVNKTLGNITTMATLHKCTYSVVLKYLVRYLSLWQSAAGQKSDGCK
jgi:hypothetical protein